jgi:uncharacterized caspase-like protein
MRYRRRITTALALVSLLACLASQATAQASRRVALVIGNGAFSGEQKLAAPGVDAKDMAAALTALGFSVTSLIDADLASMSRASRAFIDAAAGAEIALFYYSGYAVQAGGSNWLLPAGAEDGPGWSAKADALSADTILSGIAGRALTSVFILEARAESPFAARSGSAALAKSSAENSIVAFWAASGGSARGGNGESGSAFTHTLIKEMQTPGKSAQEAVSAAAERSGAQAGGKASPWISLTTPALFYFSTPEAAIQLVLAKKAEAESAVKQLDARVGDLKARIAGEKDQEQRRLLDAEMKAQADLLAAKKRELEDVKADHQRKVSASDARAEEAAMLASLASDQAAREETVGKLAELRHWEIESLVGGAEGADGYLKAVETAAANKADLSARFRAAIAEYKTAIGDAYGKRVKAVSSWTKYPWESDADFAIRAADERIRLNCEKQARTIASAALSDAKEKALLDPFDAVTAKALSGLEAARSTYSKESVAVTVDSYDSQTSLYSITISSKEPELPFKATVRYSVEGKDADDLRARYLEFEGWRSAKALSCEIDASVSALPGGGYAAVVEAFRLKALTAGGERLLAEEQPIRPVARFKGTADRERPVAVSSWLSMVGTGATLSVNGGAGKKDRLFLLDPKAGNYVVRAVLDDGSFIERRAELKTGESALVEFRLGRFTIPWLAAGSTVSVRGAPKASESERAKGSVSSVSTAATATEFVRDYAQKENATFRSPLIPEGRYRISISGDYKYTSDIDLPALAEIELPGYKSSLSAAMAARKLSMEKSIAGMSTRKKIGVITLSVGAVGALGAAASYFLGAKAAEDLRNAKDTDAALEAHKRYDIYSVIFPISAVIGGLGLGSTPILMFVGPNNEKLQKSIDSLDSQIKALAN